MSLVSSGMRLVSVAHTTSSCPFYLVVSHSLGLTRKSLLDLKFYQDF